MGKLYAASHTKGKTNAKGSGSGGKTIKGVNKDYEKNLANWLLHYRNTPNSVTKQTPAMMMFNRPTRTLLSLLDPLTNKQDNLERQSTDDGKKKLRTFQIGEKVRIYNTRTDQWYKGFITGKEGCKVYLVKSLSGIVERRHVDHLRQAVDLDDWPDQNPEPVESRHKPISIEHDQAEPIVIDPEPETHDIPQPIEPSLERPKLVPKQPVIELVRQNPANMRPSYRDVVANDHAKPTRVSSRQKANVQRFNYSKLGG